VVKTALEDLSVGDGPLDIDDHLEKLIQQQNQQGVSMEVAPYNPFAQRQPGSWDAICMDRMITVKRPKNVKSGQMWITDAMFAEVLSLLPLNKSEQAAYWKKFKKIQMMASGELNRKIVDSRQERLMVELLTQKSRLDVSPNGNLNEREMWVTTRQQLEQTLRAPPTVQPKGFIHSLFGGGGKR
jgi:hypothetical protein